MFKPESQSAIANLILIGIVAVVVRWCSMGGTSLAELDELSPKELTLIVNINRATALEFDLLPRVGPKLADRIVAYRDRVGEFRNLEDLNNVKGIGPKTLQRMRPYLTVGENTNAEHLSRNQE